MLEGMLRALGRKTEGSVDLRTARVSVDTEIPRGPLLAIDVWVNG